MLLILQFCFLSLLQSTYMDEADHLRAEGNLIRAESIYLSQEPQPDDVFRVGMALSDISLRIGNTDTSVQFFQTYLTKSKSWRGVAALVLAALAADRQAYDDFANYADILFNEYPVDHPVRWRLLYHSARYTRLEADKLKLEPLERVWFKAARSLKGTETFPSGPDLDPLPSWLQNLHLLQTTQLKEPTTQTAQLDGEYLYFDLLIQLKQALLAKAPANAARLINQIMALDQKLERNDLRIFFYPSLAEFFKTQGEDARAAKVERNLELARTYAVLPFVCLPARLKSNINKEAAETKVAAGKATEKTVALDVTTTSPVKKPNSSGLSPAEIKPNNEQPSSIELKKENPATELGPQPPDTFDVVEQNLIAGSRSMELKIRSLETATQYQKTYRNYLFGLHFLNTMRDAEAYDRLSAAAAQVAELPFPNLEVKIMLGLASYQERIKKPEKAAWYRLQALQVWTAPANLPLFAKENENPNTPAYALLDQALGSSGSHESIHNLLHYSELAQFSLLLQRAYRRETLCANPVLGGQITQIGNQLAQHVASLAENPDHEANPRRYNETLELWNTLWEQTIHYFQKPETPSVKDLQQALGSRDRIISFIEGEKRLGVLLISKTQAFGLTLGDKKTFLALNDDERMGFLVGRLGSIWEGEGMLYMALSQTWRGCGLLPSMIKKMQNRSKLCLIFSVKFFIAEKSRSTCSGTAFFSDTTLPADFEPTMNIDSISLRGLQRRDFDVHLEQHSNLVYAGPLDVSDRGLNFGDSQERLYFHEIVHYNANLCSLTLVALKPLAWDSILNDLELLNPSSATTINLVDSISNLSKVRLNNGGSGIRFY